MLLSAEKTESAMEDFVLQNLVNGGREAQIQAAAELSKFSSKKRHNMAENGVIAPLILMLQSQDYEAIEAAIFGLLSLAFGSERNKIRIVNAGALPVLLGLLQCENEQLIEFVMAALLVLSSCAANKPTFASAGAIPPLLETLQGRYAVNNDNTVTITKQAKLDAISTIHNLSTYRQTIPPMVSSGAVFALLQIIHCGEKSSELVDKAIAVLQNIVASSHNALLQAAGTGGAIRALVETIEEGSSQQCKEHAVGILLLMCQSCREKYRGLILREGVMPGLLQLSVDGTWRAKEMTQELLMLLRDFSGYESRSKQSKCELVEQIMQEIDEDGERVMGTRMLRVVEEMIAKLNT